jgi:FixJ family two-component response regulator
MQIPKPTVYVVDPDPEARTSVATLVREAGWTPEACTSGEEVLAQPRTLAPSCLLLEQSVPSADGSALQQRIAASRREMPVIIISSRPDVALTVRAMRSGAVDFLVKPHVPEVLLGALREALALSGTLLRQELQLQELLDRHASLTEREREVMSRVVSGLLNKQVAAELGISVITVKAHRGKVMRKMGAGSLAELVRMALRLGIATAPTPRSYRCAGPRRPSSPQLETGASYETV